MWHMGGEARRAAKIIAREMSSSPSAHTVATAGSPAMETSA
jgi:hypothetical protein